jgi:ATP-dependent RNA helicase A
MDIKQRLYAILGKKKLGKPNYEFIQENNNNRTNMGRFRCQCTVDGIKYGLILIYIKTINCVTIFFLTLVGLGSSRTKKDAQSNAARDFGQFLVREGIITPAELPELSLQV